MKIQGQNKEMLAAACQMFLGKTEAEIAHIALETLEGHQRAIMAHMTVEVGLGDRRRPGRDIRMRGTRGPCSLVTDDESDSPLPTVLSL